MAKRDLGERVAPAAQQALDNKKYVCAVDVLTGMGLLQPYYLERWRRGEVPHLEAAIQCNLNKLSEKKQQRLIEKAAAPKELLVFSTLRNSQCSECHRDLYKGRFLTLENGAALCLDCADLGHLEFLPSGDAALTRRARQVQRSAGRGGSLQPDQRTV